MNIQLQIVPDSDYTMPCRLSMPVGDDINATSLTSASKMTSESVEESSQDTAKSSKQNGEGFRRLNILSTADKKVLMTYFEQDPEWTKPTVDQATETTGVTKAKVYKWGSDRKRYMINKMRKTAKKTQFTTSCDDLKVTDSVDLNIIVSDLLSMIDNEFAYCQQLFVKTPAVERCDVVTNAISEHHSVSSGEFKHKDEVKANDFDFFVSECSSVIADDDLLDRRLGFLPANKKYGSTDLLDMTQISTNCQLNLDFSDLRVCKPANEYLEF
jgi:hypothetical protein